MMFHGSLIASHVGCRHMSTVRTPWQTFIRPLAMIIYLNSASGACLSIGLSSKARQDTADASLPSPLL